MSKQDNGTGNVHQLPCVPATEVKPPDEWRLRLELTHGRSTATYFQKADASTPLVRILDVLTDFADRRGLPAGAAVADFLVEADETLLQQVYWLRESNFAELVGVDHMYGALTVAEAKRKTREARDHAAEMRLEIWEAKPTTYTGMASPLAAFKEYIKAAASGKDAQDLYAVSHATAHKLWGWGRVVTEQDQATEQPAPAMEALKVDAGKQSHYDWKGNPALHAKLVSDYGKAKGSEKAKREAVAKEWGLSPASIKKQLPFAKAAVKAAEAAEAAAKNPLDPAAFALLMGRSSQ